MSQLEPLDIQSLRQIQSLYRQDWPKYCQEFYGLKYFIAFVKAEPDIKHLKAYTLRDERAKELGLFLIVDRYQLLMGCLGNGLDLLEQALKLVDWSGGLLCTSMSTRYIATVYKVVHEMQLPIEFQIATNLYHMPAKQALQFDVECPAGFHLKSLSEQDAHLIDEDWAYRQEGSLYFMQRQIRLCPSMGLYDDATQQLVAWCLRSQDGLLAALQVRKTHLRRGFGSLVVQALSKRIAALGDDVSAEVYSENIPSANMFSNLGFRVIQELHWLSTLPATGSFTWPTGE